jgi:hypothetical protein
LRLRVAFGGAGGSDVGAGGVAGSGSGCWGSVYSFLPGDDGDLAGDDVVRLDLAAGVVVLAAAQLTDDVNVRAFGEVTGGGGEFVPNSDAMPFGELLAGGAFAPEAAGGYGEVQDDLTAVQFLGVRVGSYETLHRYRVDISLVRHRLSRPLSPVFSGTKRVRGGRSQAEVSIAKPRVAGGRGILGEDRRGNRNAVNAAPPGAGITPKLVPRK